MSLANGGPAGGDTAGPPLVHPPNTERYYAQSDRDNDHLSDK